MLQKVRVTCSEGWKLISPYSAVAIFFQMVQMACSFVSLRWVPPDQMGVWQTMLLIESYCMIVRLGVGNAMNREFPFLMGQGKNREALECVRTTEAYTLVVSAVEGLGLAVAAVCLVGSGEAWLLGLATLAIYAPLNLYRGFLETTFRSGQEFSKLAGVQWILMGFSLLSLWLVYAYGFRGFCFRNVLLAALSAGLYYWLRPVRAFPRFSSKVLKYLLWAGLPLLISNYLTSIASGFNKLILLGQGGVHFVGLYTPVAAVLTLGTLLPSTLAIYLLPKLNFSFGTSRNSAHIVDQAWKASIASGVALLPFIAVGWFLTPWFIQKFIPLYEPSVRAMQWALFISLANCLKTSATSFSVLQAWTPMFFYLTGLIITSWLGPWLAIRYYPTRPLEAVTLGALAGVLCQIPITVICLRVAGGRETMLRVRETSALAT